MAVCLLESRGGKDGEAETAAVEEARKLMERVPTLRQKIAGKSIPLEASFPSLLLFVTTLTLTPRNS
jgi:hypothetical protein